jgi:hypothetical protein
MPESPRSDFVPSDAYPERHRRPPPSWVRWALLVVAVGVALYGLWATPVPQPPKALLEDLRAGRADRVTLACSDTSLTFRTGTSPTFGDQVCWSDGTLLYRVSRGELRAAMRSPAGSSSIDLAATIRATAADAGDPRVAFTETAGPVDVDSPLPQGLYLLAVVIALGFLISGPQPRRLTKWGVFWTLGIPGNVGVVWWLLREAPWDPRANALPEPADYRVRRMYDGRKRRGGGEMLLWLVLAAVVWAMLTWLGGAALGALLEPSGDVGRWVARSTS